MPDPYPAIDEESKAELQDIEVQLLTEGIYKHYGFDFRDYSLPSLRRRIWKRVYAEGLSTVSGLIEKVLHDPQCMERLLLDLSVNTTAMFRDPTFYLAFRRKVVPMLRTYPFVRIWHAGCSTGEEVYSMAILLQEEGLYDRCRIYATDINEAVLAKAKSGIFPIQTMQENRLLHGPLRLRDLPAVAALERRLRAAQPRDRRLVQSLQRDLLPQRADLLQQRSSGPRAGALPRVDGDVRHPRPRKERNDSLHRRHQELRRDRR
jgi:hypothetical protein